MKSKRLPWLFPLLILAGVSFTAPGCKKDDDNTSTNANTVYNLSGTASGSQEVPAVTTSGTGSLTGTYNAGTNTLTYNVSWSGLSGTATGGHFHGPAPAGQTAGVQIGFTLNNNGTAGSAFGTNTLTDTQETDLLAGKWYYNIHTAANQGGEIRAQVVLTRQ